VNISSRALAKVFRMEFSDRRKREVVIPIAALLQMIIRAPGEVTAEPIACNHK